MIELLVRSSDSRAVEISVTGELDGATAPVVRELVDDVLVILKAPTILALNFAGLTFMDSQGLSLLIRERRVAQARGVRLVVREPSAPVRRLLSLTAMDHFIEDASVVSVN